MALGTCQGQRGAPGPSCWSAPEAKGGGFQTPLEQQCLGILPRGTVPVTIYPARLFDAARHRLYGRSLEAAVRRGVADGRVTIVEPPEMVGERIIIPNARKRNLHLLGLCEEVLLLYATPGGDTEGLAPVALGRGLPVSVLDHPANAVWLDLGATVWSFAAAGTGGHTIDRSEQGQAPTPVDGGPAPTVSTPGGRTDGLGRVALRRRPPVAVLDHPANAVWLDLGATVWV